MRMNGRTRLALSLLAVAAASAAIRSARHGDSNDAVAATTVAAQPDPAFDPCTLVDSAGASRALGVSLPAGQLEPTLVSLGQGRVAKAHACAFGAPLTITRVYLGRDDAAGHARFDEHRASLAETAGYRAVADIGDAAFVAENQLRVRQNDLALIVDVRLAPADSLRERAAERAVALLASARVARLRKS